MLVVMNWIVTLYSNTIQFAFATFFHFTTTTHPKLFDITSLAVKHNTYIHTCVRGCIIAPRTLKFSHIKLEFLVWFGMEEKKLFALSVFSISGLSHKMKTRTTNANISCAHTINHYCTPSCTQEIQYVYNTVRNRTSVLYNKMSRYLMSYKFMCA